MSKSAHRLSPGTRLDNFQIRQVLGAGGFGITYQAFDKKNDCLVAIKKYFPASLATRANRRDPLLPVSLACKDRYSPSFLASVDRMLQLDIKQRPQSAHDLFTEFRQTDNKNVLDWQAEDSRQTNNLCTTDETGLQNETIAHSELMATSRMIRDKHRKYL